MLEKGSAKRQEIVRVRKIVMRQLAHAETGLRGSENRRRVGAVIKEHLATDAVHEAREQIGKRPREGPADQRRSAGMLQKFFDPLADPFLPTDFHQRALWFYL